MTYAVTRKGFSNRDEVNAVVARVVDTLANAGYHVSHNADPSYDHFQEVSTYSNLAYEDLLEYYTTQCCGGVRLYFFLYGHMFIQVKDRYGVLVMLDDEVVAMQLKLMLA